MTSAKMLIALALLGCAPLAAQDRAATLEYAHAVYRAHAEFRNGQSARALALLESCREDLRGWEWHYVNRLCRPEQLTLPAAKPDGTKRNFQTASYSPDGKLILTADGDANASLWDADTGALARTFTEQNFKVRHAHFSPDGKQVLTSGDATTATIWDTATGKPVRTLERKQRAIGAANWSHDGKRLVTSGNRDITVWDTQTGTELRSFPSIAFYSCRPSFNKDGTRIVSNGFGASGTFDPETGKQLVRVPPGGNGTTNIARFHPDGTRFVASATDGIARVHKTDDGSIVLEIKGHKTGVGSSAYSADGKRIVTTSDRTLRLWDAESGKELKSWLTTGGLLDATFHPNGDRILSVEAGAVKVWAIDAEPVQVLPVEPGSWIIDATFSPDGKEVAAGSTGKVGWYADVWDLATNKTRLQLGNHDYVVHQVIYSPDGSRILTRTGTGRSTIWDAKSGKELLDPDTQKDQKDWSDISGFNRDGTKLVSLKGGSLQLRDLKTGAVLREMKGDAAFRTYWPGPGDGELTTYSGGKLSRWNEDKGEVKSAVACDGAPKGIEYLWLSPDAKRLIVSERNGPATLWDATNGRKIGPLPALTVYSKSKIAFTPDGSRFAVATAGDTNAHILDAATGIELLAFPALPKNVGCLAFSPDGTRLLAGTSNDDPLRIHTGGPGPKAKRK
ncbi:MAG: PQQ-binding-like beta-propeller repeat protein [Gemmataceae bacterium]|nr:PQQ-binding-like beta-propeller repeat protein [Gemmataceae bacterium]